MSTNFSKDAADCDSDFDDEERIKKKKKRYDLAEKDKKKRGKKGTIAEFNEEASRDEGRRQRFHLLSLNAFDRHKQLINNYMLYHPGSTEALKRDTSRDKRDIDVLREHHQFLWDDSEVTSWEKKLAKKYYDKLFKEYCICDLSCYKVNKIAMRWRIESEVVSGKGQFICGAKKCSDKDMLRSWEVNFSYIEKGDKKNALVKVRLCPDCSYKLNYSHKKKEIVTKKHKKKSYKKDKKTKTSETIKDDDESSNISSRSEEQEDEEDIDIWKRPLKVNEEDSRNEEFSEYLDDLFM